MGERAEKIIAGIVKPRGGAGHVQGPLGLLEDFKQWRNQTKVLTSKDKAHHRIQTFYLF